MHPKARSLLSRHPCFRGRRAALGNNSSATLSCRSLSLQMSGAYGRIVRSRTLKRRLRRCDCCPTKVCPVLNRVCFAMLTVRCPCTAATAAEELHVPGAACCAAAACRQGARGRGLSCGCGGWRISPASTHVARQCRVEGTGGHRRRSAPRLSNGQRRGHPESGAAAARTSGQRVAAERADGRAR